MIPHRPPAGVTIPLLSPGKTTVGGKRHINRHTHKHANTHTKKTRKIRRGIETNGKHEHDELRERTSEANERKKTTDKKKKQKTEGRSETKQNENKHLEKKTSEKLTAPGGGGVMG